MAAHTPQKLARVFITNATSCNPLYIFGSDRELSSRDLVHIW